MAAASSLRDGPLPLPPSFISIAKALQTPPGRFVNIIGVVKQILQPTKTTRDWKTTVTLTEPNEDVSVDVMVFKHSFDDLPKPGGLDVMVITGAKIQDFQGQISLLSNKTTALYIYSESKIPRYPLPADIALAPLPRGNAGPTAPVHSYVSWIHAVAEKATALPLKFEIDTKRDSFVPRDKFSLLKDVKVDQFYDIIVRVVRQPFSVDATKTTMWVTDFTENKHFYDRPDDGFSSSPAPNGNSQGYPGMSMIASGWDGPSGKHSLQVTCFDEHSYTAAELKQGAWVKLCNVQITYGQNSASLEAKLRGDANAFRGKQQVQVLDVDGHQEGLDPRLAAAIRRKRDYYKKRRKETAKTHKESVVETRAAEVLAELNDLNDSQLFGDADKKRKAESEPNGGNGDKKKRRGRNKGSREQTEAKGQEEAREETVEQDGRLNRSVVCERMSHPTFKIAEMLQQVESRQQEDEQTMLLPFNNARYRADVRVVNFLPDDLADFSKLRRHSEEELLSDYSISDGEYSDQGEHHNRLADLHWEWRFALLLEDATVSTSARNGEESTPPERMWVTVDNLEAEHLLNMNATNLRREPDVLARLGDKLRKLWGNVLERKKELELERPLPTADQPTPSRGVDLNAWQRPPISTDDGDPRPAAPSGAAEKDDFFMEALSGVENSPFPCCLRQFGVAVECSEPEQCDAGEGREYIRCFGLCGTRIL